MNVPTEGPSEPADSLGTPLAVALGEFATAEPFHPAVSCGTETLTRERLEARSNSLARDLAQRGVGLGDFVTIVLPNSVEHVVATVAAWKLGAIPQPLSPKLAVREQADVVDLASPAAIIGSEDPAVVGTRPAFPAGYDPIADDESPLPPAVPPSWKAPTSGGTTGRPKLIVAGQPGVVESLLGFAGILHVNGGVTLITGPLSHNGPFAMAALTLLTGGHVVIMPKFDPAATLELIARHRAEVVYAVPTMMSRIWRLPEPVRLSPDLSSLRVWFHMAAPCPPWLKEAWLDWLGEERVLELYAGTEAQAATVIDGKEWRTHRGSVGRAVLGEVQVRDADGRAVGAREIGRIWLRGPAAGKPSYYYIGADATADGDGWETLGDLGWLDEDGYLYLSDRDDDMFVVGGSNVYPAEVEAVIAEHPDVFECCVVGIPDDDLGRIPHAFVHARTPISAEELQEFVTERLAPYKRPRSYEFVDQPLRDDAGKIRRGTLIHASPTS